MCVFSDSATRKMAEHGTRLSIYPATKNTFAVVIIHSKHWSGGKRMIFDDVPLSCRGITNVVLFVHRHCPYLSLLEILHSLEMYNAWQEAHRDADAIDVLTMRAALSEAGLQVEVFA